MSEKNIYQAYVRDRTVDELISSWMQTYNPRERLELFNRIWWKLETEWKRLAGWGGLGAWGTYYISPDRTRCIYLEVKECYCTDGRYEPFVRTIKEIKFSSPAELVDIIWRRHGEAIPREQIIKMLENHFNHNNKPVE